ncbi:MAG: hypothetical protein KF861_24295, partial [Planctomycetaceae bacterium]|nr:hypothetical protein [Planctomycetaceae bacterium]
MLTLHRGQAAAAAVFCLIAWGTPSMLTAADAPPAERRLPTGTSVFASVPDANSARERFLETSYGQMLSDDAFGPIREEIAAWWEEKSENTEKDLGIPPAELLNLLHGELAFAVVQPPGKDLGVVFFVEFGEHRDTLETLLEKARGTLEEQAERSVDSVQDTEVTTYMFDESDEGNGRGSMSYIIKDEHFVLVFAGAENSKGVMEEILLRWDGEHDQCFAEDPLFRELMLKCQDPGGLPPQFRWYFSPIDLFRAVVTMPQANQGPVSPAMVMGFLPVLGLDKFKAVGGTSTLKT